MSTIEQLQRGLACRHPRQTFEGCRLPCAVPGCTRGIEAPDLVVALMPREPRFFMMQHDPADPISSGPERVILRRVGLHAEPFVEWGRDAR